VSTRIKQDPSQLGETGPSVVPGPKLRSSWAGAGPGAGRCGGCPHSTAPIEARTDRSTIPERGENKGRKRCRVDGIGTQGNGMVCNASAVSFIDHARRRRDEMMDDGGLVVVHGDGDE